MSNLFSTIMIAYVWCYLVGVYIHGNIKPIKGPGAWTKGCEPVQIRTGGHTFQRQRRPECRRILSAKKVYDSYEKNSFLGFVVHLAHIFSNGLLCRKIATLLCLKEGDTGMVVVDFLKKIKYIRISLTSSRQSYISADP